MNPEDPVDVFMSTAAAAGLITGVIAGVLLLARRSAYDKYCPSGELHQWTNWQPIASKHQWRGCQKCGYSELKAM